MRHHWRAIDPHVHCRDEEQSAKTTISEVLGLAHSQGIDLIFDMPNTEVPVVDRQRVWDRLNLVPKGEKDNYRLYVGLTGDESQIVEALWCYNNIPEAIGLKMFCGRSVGDLSVTETAQQQLVYQVLSKQRFQGVLALHCEKEEHLNTSIWDANAPITHGQARPEIAEEMSIVDQINFASDTNYQGRMHICHVSTPAGVRAVHAGRSVRLDISCAVTPHHLMWDESKMTGAEGLIYKMNPPLRGKESVSLLREQLLAGMIDLIETDHAPHTAAEKAPPKCLSGYPSLSLYRQFVGEFLPGIGLSESMIHKLTLDNILAIFGDKL